MSKSRYVFGIWLWILSLAILAVGARNFESSLVVDGPVYADIARNIVHNHEWLRMESSVPDYRPFFEHPHLAFWLQALVFKVLPIADWSARIPGHIYYVLFLGLFFFYLRWIADEKTAVATVILLWLWGRFTNSFSNCVLDPGALFWGTAGVFALDVAFQRKWIIGGALSGLCFVLCVMTKGLMVFGFAPTGALLVGMVFLDRDRWKLYLATLMLFGLTMVLGFFGYWWLVHASQIPDFFALYWHRQMTNRFLHIWSLQNLVAWDFWKRLLEFSFYLAPFSLLALGRVSQGRRILIPGVLLLSFILANAPNKMIGTQYWVEILPWLAWLVADGVFARLNWDPAFWRRLTMMISMGLVLVVQYLPLATHSHLIDRDESELGRLRASLGLTRLWEDQYPHGLDFLQSARYAWYGNLKVEYVSPREGVPAAEAQSAYLTYWPEAQAFRKADLKKKGWCLQAHFGERTLWVKCPFDLELLPY